MPTLVVLDREIELPEAVAAPLIAADVLYWDTMGGDDGEEPPHLHINPEIPGFGHIEAAVYEGGPALLAEVTAIAQGRTDWPSAIRPE